MQDLDLSSKNIIEVNNLYLNLSGREILKDVNFSLPHPSFYCVAGPNGAGKSVLFRTIAGYYKPDRGRVRIFGKDIHRISPEERASLLAFLPQKSSFFYPFPVEEVVKMGAYRLKNVDGMKVLKQLGFLHLCGRIYTSLSEGERKIVLVAKLLAQKTPIIVLDEPASNLDLKNQLKIYGLLSHLVKKGKTVLVSEHNLNLLPYCQRIFFLKGGKIIVEGRPREVMRDEIISHVYDFSASETMPFSY